MSFDITYCTGVGCALKNDCRRYKLLEKYTGSVSFESWIKPPFKVKKGVFSCEMFWGVKNDAILVSLMDIFGIDSKTFMDKWKKKKPKKK